MPVNASALVVKDPAALVNAGADVELRLEVNADRCRGELMFEVRLLVPERPPLPPSRAAALEVDRMTFLPERGASTGVFSTGSPSAIVTAPSRVELPSVAVGRRRSLGLAVDRVALLTGVTSRGNSPVASAALESIELCCAR